MDGQLEVAQSAGNVSLLGSPDAAAGPLKAMLASRIVAALDRQGLSVRAAEKVTQFAAADFSRVRRGNLARFTVDRLLAMLGALDPTIELSLMVRPKLTRDRVIAAIKAHETEIRAEGATALYLFGSVARDEAGPQSDVDIYVDYEPDTGFSLLHMAGIKQLLEDNLGVPVSITTKNAFKPPMKEVVEREAVHVF